MSRVERYFGKAGILEEWGHFVAASRKIGNFDKWVVIWGVEVKDVGKVESKKISLKFGENIGKVTISNSKTYSFYPLQ